MGWKGLALAVATQNPWALLQDLAAAWHGLRIPSGLPAPALRRWYDAFARHPELSNSQHDQLADPATLKAADGVLPLLVENQGVWRVGVREAERDAPDPPVLWTSDWKPAIRWQELSPSFSRFALLWGIHSTAFEARFSAVGNLHDKDASPLLAELARIPLDPLPLYGGVMRYHAGDDLLLQEQDFEGSGDCDYVVIAGRNREARDRAMRLVEAEWDSVS